MRYEVFRVTLNPVLSQRIDILFASSSEGSGAAGKGVDKRRRRLPPSTASAEGKVREPYRDRIEQLCFQSTHSQYAVRAS